MMPEFSQILKPQGRRGFLRTAGLGACGALLESPVMPAVTGELPPLPPRWAFGHIKSKDEFMGRQDILSDVAWMEENDVPCEVFHIDAPWAAGLNLFEFAEAKVLHSKLHPDTVGQVYDFSAPGESPYMADPEDPHCRPTTPGPHFGQSIIDTLHSKGIHLTVWMTHMINNGGVGGKHPFGHPFGIGQFEGQAEREAQVFAFAESNGFLVKDSRAWHRGFGKQIDYQNPEAVAWWHRMMDKVLDMGVDGFVLDFGANLDYLRDTFRYLRKKKGDQAIMMSRSAKGVGPITLLTWAIDTKNDFSDKGIKYALDQILIASENGTPYVSGTQSPRGDSPSEQFVAREVQFNAFCPVHFTFCYGDLSNPWQHGETATKVFKYYTRLHNELLPCIYSAAIRAHRTGEAIIKRVPGDLQYTFADDLLVAPIYRDEMKRRVTFPAGEWIDYWDEAKVYRAGQELSYAAPLDHIPLFVRAGAIIPMEVKKDWTGHGTKNSAGALTVLVYPSGSVRRWFYETSGDTLFGCVKDSGYRSQKNIRFELDGPKREYVLRVKTFTAPKEVRSSRAGALLRCENESQLTPERVAWCFDADAGLVIIRLTRTDSEAIHLVLE